MLHTLMETDFHATFPPSKVRGSAGLSLVGFRHYKPRISKRERSPEDSEIDTDRPLVCIPRALNLRLQ